jgi:hypothetical protein
MHAALSSGDSETVGDDGGDSCAPETSQQSINATGENRRGLIGIHSANSAVEIGFNMT